MVTSRNSQSPESSDPLAAALDSLSLSSGGARAPMPPSGSRPPSVTVPPDPFAAAAAALSTPVATHGVSTRSRALSGSGAPPPSSTQSAPLTGRAGGSGGVVRYRGHLNGKVPLFRYGPSKEGTICGGYIGTAGLRFCCKEVLVDVGHCGDQKHGRSKFNLTKETYYVQMEGETALCWPCVSMKDLMSHNALSMVNQSKTSRDWIDELNQFIHDHNIAPPEAAAEGENEAGATQDQVSDIDEVSLSGRSAATKSNAPSSLASFRAGSRSFWDRFRPQEINENLPMAPDEKWFPHVELMHKTMLGLSHSVHNLMDQLPIAFDSVQGAVSYPTFSSEAVLPIQELSCKLDEVIENVFDDRHNMYDHSSWLASGSLIGYTESISERLAAVDDDFQERLESGLTDMSTRAAAALRTVVERVNEANAGIIQRLSDLETSNTGGVRPTQATGGIAVDGEVYTLERLVQMVQDTSAANASLRQEVMSLKSSTYSQGVKVGSHAFEQFEDLLKLIQAESDIDVEAYATCLDCISIFAHYASGDQQSDKQTAELKAIRAAGITDPSCCLYSTSFRQTHPSYILDGGPAVKVGSRFPFLKTKLAWEGQTALEGGRGQLKQAVADAKEAAQEYISIALPRADSPLRLLAMDLLTRTKDWWDAVATYLDDEILSLTKYGIEETALFTFLSDELQVMFRKMFEKRMKMQVFSTNRDHTLYYARAIWVTLQCHEIMEEFKKAKFGTHTLISSLFTRFLAEQTGKNHGAGLSSKITQLEAEVKKVANSLNSKATAINGRLDKMEMRIKGVETKCNPTPGG